VATQCYDTVASRGLLSSSSPPKKRKQKRKKKKTSKKLGPPGLLALRGPRAGAVSK
jgi:hypothetical protein